MYVFSPRVTNTKFEKKRFNKAATTMQNVSKVIFIPNTLFNQFFDKYNFTVIDLNCLFQSQDASVDLWTILVLITLTGVGICKSLCPQHLLP